MIPMYVIKNIIKTTMFLHYLIVILAISDQAICFRQRHTRNLNHARIFNGQNASKNQFPWHVFIIVTFKGITKPIYNGRGGGVLISKNHFLTAAHNEGSGDPARATPGSVRPLDYLFF